MIDVAAFEARKRAGRRLAPDEIDGLVRGYFEGSVDDEQMSRVLHAVKDAGMDRDETGALIRAMLATGRTLSLPKDPRRIVDKHSTGGVGDKVSLVLAPLLATLGARVPMISARGSRGIGGTIDKLDAIEGFHHALSLERMIEVVQEVGCAIASQSDDLVPVDRRLFALRSGTGTLACVPLIAGSILSKKMAESLDALVIDVKCGSGALMKTSDHALELARVLAGHANALGIPARAMVTDMSRPVGSAAGHWLEVREAIGCLLGEGPADLDELVCALAGELVEVDAYATLKRGDAYATWERMVAAQGADPAAVKETFRSDHAAPFIHDVVALRSGAVATCDAGAVGEIVHALGGGRIDNATDLALDVGVDRLAPVGSEVAAGDLLGRIHANTPEAAEAGAAGLANAFSLSDDPVEAPPRVLQVV